MPYTIVFSPEAETQLTELYGYLAAEASPDNCCTFHRWHRDVLREPEYSPLRGVKRDDVRPGIRITNYRRRVVVAFDRNFLRRPGLRVGIARGKYAGKTVWHLALFD